MHNYTYRDMMHEMQQTDEELRTLWSDARPWGNHGAMVVWLKDGRIYKVQKAGDKFVKQPLTREEVRKKFGI